MTMLKIENQRYQRENYTLATQVEKQQKILR